MAAPMNPETEIGMIKQQDNYTFLIIQRLHSEKSKVKKKIHHSNINLVLQQFEKRVPNKFFFYFIFDGSWCQRLDFMLFDCYDDGVLIKYHNKQFRLDFVLFLFFDRND